MNKRQAKKAFKKKYGVNPNQASKELLKALEKMDMDKIMYNVCEGIRKAMNLFADFMEEAPQIIAEQLDILTERVREYNERVDNGEIDIAGQKVLLDMRQTDESTQTPCDTWEKEQS